MKIIESCVQFFKSLSVVMAVTFSSFGIISAFPTELSANANKFSQSRGVRDSLAPRDGAIGRHYGFLTQDQPSS